MRFFKATCLFRGSVCVSKMVESVNVMFVDGCLRLETREIEMSPCGSAYCL